MTETPLRPAAARPPRRRIGSRWVAVACLIAVAGLTACSSSKPTHRSPSVTASASSSAQARIGDISIRGSYIPQPASPDVAAAYLTIVNSGSSSDTVTRVTTSVTNDVMAMSEADSGGVGTMTDLSSVTIPAHGSITLSPGHAHLMLEQPDQTLVNGDQVRMTITFAKAGTVSLTVPVVPLTGPVISSGNMSGMPGMGGG